VGTGGAVPVVNISKKKKIQILKYETYQPMVCFKSINGENGCFDLETKFIHISQRVLGKRPPET
jgi:hypothetical protein